MYTYTNLSVGPSTPKTAPYTSILPKRTGQGRAAKCCPKGVTLSNCCCCCRCLEEGVVVVSSSSCVCAFLFCFYVVCKRGFC